MRRSSCRPITGISRSTPRTAHWSSPIRSRTRWSATTSLTGVVAAPRLPFTWLTWWIGDSFGTVIAAPIALTLIGRPREDWAPRRLTVGFTLAAATGLLAAMIALVMRWDAQRLRSNFEREALSAASSLSFQLQEPLHALEAVRGVYIASNEVTRDELRRAAKAWLDGLGHLQAIGFSERVQVVVMSVSSRDGPALYAKPGE